MNGFAERRPEGQPLDDGNRKRGIRVTKDPHSLSSLILRATLSTGGPPNP